MWGTSGHLVKDKHSVGINRPVPCKLKHLWMLINQLTNVAQE